MNKRQIQREAAFHAGHVLQSILNGWEPDDLIQKYGRDTVDEISTEIHAIAEKLIEQGSR